MRELGRDNWDYRRIYGDSHCGGGQYHRRKCRPHRYRIAAAGGFGVVGGNRLSEIPENQRNGAGTDFLPVRHSCAPVFSLRRIDRKPGFGGAVMAGRSSDGLYGDC